MPTLGAPTITRARPPRIRYTTSSSTTSLFHTDDWLAPTQPYVNVEIDYGGRTITGTADSWVRLDDGTAQVRGVRWSRYNTEGWRVLDNDGDDGYQPTWWPTTATDAAGTINVDFGATGTTGGVITFRANTATTNWIIQDTHFPLTPAQIKQEELRKKLRPLIHNHHGKVARSADKGRQFDNARPEELVALGLLRKMVAPEEFKRYLKHGFVHVRGPSGLVYQVGRHELIKVWDRDVPVCTLCVHLKDSSIPPTDAVVAKMLIVECDEPDIWRRANKGWIDRDGAQRPSVKKLLAA